VLGFAYLARVDTALARASFTEAIRLDSAAPLPRLGLGLALIRDGELTAGREQIDIAVILDPGNALIRAYIGKAYYEEKRDELAATQLGIAKELDPNDPTAFFYDAIRKQTVNRPVEALEDMTESVALNDNRAVYRSRLLLDEDLAARSAAVGRTYRDLSFDELALRKGWKSVATDPSDFSGHRLLADSYSSLPRHEIARVNELLQSQLLQPLNITPVQPQLGEANLFILDTAGPTAISFNEFNPLFNRDRLAIQSSAVVGGNDTWGADAVVAGIDGPWSASLGGYHFETDGFRENNDLEQSVGSLLVQRRLSADTSVLAEVRATDREEGDLVLRAKELPFPSTGRASDDSATVRIGLRHDFSPSTTGLALIAYEDVSLANFSSVGSFRIAQDVDNYTAELQVLHRAVNWSLTSGVRYYGSTVDENTTLLIPIPDPPFEIPVQGSDGFRPQDISGYAYANFALPANVVLTAGASIDLLEGRNFERDRFNPKLGVVWQPTTDTTVRLAAFQTLQRPNPSRLDIQPSLEPTPVAGFNQFFAGSEAEEARRLGLGIDHRLSGELQAGLEISRRWLDIPFFEQTPPPDVSLRTVTTDVTESQARGYLYWLASDRISAGASYEYDLFENDANFFPFGYLTLETHRLPLEASYFHPSGVSAGVVATGVWQRGDFQVFPFAPTERDSDDFWVADAFAAFRLPGRHGVIRIEAQNLFDKSIQFQDVDPQNPRIFPERTILLRATIAY
jgi:outer membrane receptor protein involved in Fe transport